ncbi:MAG: hydrogenase maturation nickel metallochaperone HypA [Candidatus Zixiibacteriota bacterium]
MHELSIATGMIDIAIKEASAKKLSHIEEVGVRIGALTGVNPDALQFAFEAACADTPLAGAKLSIEYVEISGTCRTCSREIQVVDYGFICEHCGSTDLEITHGDELEITYLTGS